MTPVVAKPKMIASSCTIELAKPVKIDVLAELDRHETSLKAKICSQNDKEMRNTDELELQTINPIVKANAAPKVTLNDKIPRLGGI